MTPADRAAIALIGPRVWSEITDRVRAEAVEEYKASEGLDVERLALALDAVLGPGEDEEGYLVNSGEVARIAAEYARLREDVPVAGLDVAWAAVEAALPLTGWPDGTGRWALPSSDREIRLRWRESGDGYTEPHEEGWEASAIVYGFGAPDFRRDSLPFEATPAAALLALAARLREDVPVTFDAEDDPDVLVRDIHVEFKDDVAE